MTEIGLHHLSPRLPPVPLRASRWHTGEWGLAFLALVLAVLVWAVMWGRISDTDEVMAKLEPRTSRQFVAYYDGEVRILLQGPRSELEEARQRLGGRLVRNIDDLPPGKEYDRISLRDGEGFSFPFPHRLVDSITAIPDTVEVYRWKEIQVQFAPPGIDGIPDGVRCEITLNPPTSPVTAPAGKVGDTIEPDDLDLSDVFADRGVGALPDDVTRELVFDHWRSDPDEGRYRSDVRLPPVRATVHFLFEGACDIRNRIEFRHPKGYVVTPSAADPDVEQGYYSGHFVGIEDDLRTLENDTGSWWFVVRIPQGKLPADEEDHTEDLPIEFVHVQALDGLRVRFVEGATLLVVIRRES